MKTKRSDYSTPTKRVVQMKHRQQLLEANNVQGSRQSYVTEEAQTWE